MSGKGKTTKETKTRGIWSRESQARSAPNRKEKLGREGLKGVPWSPATVAIAPGELRGSEEHVGSGDMETRSQRVSLLRLKQELSGREV